MMTFFFFLSLCSLQSAQQEFHCGTALCYPPNILKMIPPQKKVLSPHERGCKDSSLSQVLPAEHAHHEGHNGKPGQNNPGRDVAQRAEV